MGCAGSRPDGFADEQGTVAATTASGKQQARGEVPLKVKGDELAKPDGVEVVVPPESPLVHPDTNSMRGTPPAERISSTSDGLKSLSSNEADNVQDTLLKVSAWLPPPHSRVRPYLVSSCVHAAQ